MERYTLQQRIEIVKIHYRNGEKFSETVRKVRSEFGRNLAPSRTAIVKLIKKFETVGQVSDVKPIARSRNGRSMKNIAAVAESVEENPGLSIPKRSMELGISKTTLHRILREDLGMTANKVPSSDDLNPKNDVKERTFAIWGSGNQESAKQIKNNDNSKEEENDEMEEPPEKRINCDKEKSLEDKSENDFEAAKIVDNLCDVEEIEKYSTQENNEMINQQIGENL